VQGGELGCHAYGELVIEGEGDALGDGGTQEDGQACGVQPALGGVVATGGGAEELHVDLSPEEGGEDFEGGGGASVDDEGIAVAGVGDACVVGAYGEVLEAAQGFAEEHGEEGGRGGGIMEVLALEEDGVIGHSTQLQRTFGGIGEGAAFQTQHKGMPC